MNEAETDLSNSACLKDGYMLGLSCPTWGLAVSIVFFSNIFNSYRGITLMSTLKIAPFVSQSLKRSIEDLYL